MSRYLFNRDNKHPDNDASRLVISLVCRWQPEQETHSLNIHHSLCLLFYLTVNVLNHYSILIYCDVIGTGGLYFERGELSRLWIPGQEIEYIYGYKHVITSGFSWFLL